MCCFVKQRRHTGNSQWEWWTHTAHWWSLNDGTYGSFGFRWSNECGERKRKAGKLMMLILTPPSPLFLGKRKTWKVRRAQEWSEPFTIKFSINIWINRWRSCLDVKHIIISMNQQTQPHKGRKQHKEFSILSLKGRSCICKSPSITFV